MQLLPVQPIVPLHLILTFLLVLLPERLVEQVQYVREVPQLFHQMKTQEEHGLHPIQQLQL